MENPVPYQLRLVPPQEWLEFFSLWRSPSCVEASNCLVRCVPWVQASKGTMEKISDFFSTWNPKQPFINGCFNWMIPNHYIKNDCFTKHPFINGCLGFQVLTNRFFPWKSQWLIVSVVSINHERMEYFSNRSEYHSSIFWSPAFIFDMEVINCFFNPAIYPSFEGDRNRLWTPTTTWIYARIYMFLRACFQPWDMLPSSSPRRSHSHPFFCTGAVYHHDLLVKMGKRWDQQFVHPRRDPLWRKDLRVMSHQASKRQPKKAKHTSNNLML